MPLVISFIHWVQALQAHESFHMIWLTPFFTVNGLLLWQRPKTATFFDCDSNSVHNFNLTVDSSFLFIFFFQLSSSEVDYSIDSTLGSFSDAAPLFGLDSKQFIGITTFPTTPIANRTMPPVFPQPKQSSAAFSNGISSASQSSAINNSNSRTYNNNNNVNNNNKESISNNNINNVNNYQQKSSSSAVPSLAPPPLSRAVNNNITSSNSSTFVRPSDNKPLINGRPGYAIPSQLNKHEVSEYVNWMRRL